MMDKVGRVMREFKEGKLKSSSGQKVTNPKQAIAIGLSEQRAMKKEPAKKMAAGGYKAGGAVMPKKMGAVKTAAPSINGVATKGKTKGTMIKMRKGGCA
jgi:hypothetical protein